MNMRSVVFVATTAALALAGGCRGEETHRSITLEGCVQPGRSAGDYVLHDVFVPGRERQPGGTTRTRPQEMPVIRDGGVVRLLGDGLQQRIGTRVQVTGNVIDSGRNTLDDDADRNERPSTTASAQNPSGQPAVVPPGSSLSNAMAPLIAVTAVADRSGTCGTTPTPAREDN